MENTRRKPWPVFMYNSLSGIISSYPNILFTPGALYLIAAKVSRVS